MKFDAERASGIISTFAFDRTRRTGGDRIASGILANLWEAHGYQIVRREVTSQPVRELIGLIVSAGIFWSAISSGMYFTFLSQESTFLNRVGPVLLALFWAFLAGNFFTRWPDFGLGRSVTENVLANLPESSAPVRVVFFTSIDNPPRILPGKQVDLAFQSFVVLLSVGVLASPFSWSWLPLPIRAVFFVTIIGFSGICLVRWLCWRLRPGRSGEANDDGLAILVELARTWTKRYGQKIEPVFAAVGSSDDRAGTEALLRMWREAWPAKPTLFVGIWWPGSTPPFGIEVANLVAWETAEAAANGLRVPYSVLGAVRSVWGWRRSLPDYVGLIGTNGVGSTANSLGLAAQLATEIALRWAKRQAEEAGDHSDGATAAKSSQNPG